MVLFIAFSWLTDFAHHTSVAECHAIAARLHLALEPTAALRIEQRLLPGLDALR